MRFYINSLGFFLYIRRYVFESYKTKQRNRLKGFYFEKLTSWIDAVWTERIVKGFFYLLFIFNPGRIYTFKWDRNASRV